jgi:hypothetical protein
MWDYWSLDFGLWTFDLGHAWSLKVGFRSEGRFQDRRLAALPLSLRKASGFPVKLLEFEALPPGGVAANSLGGLRKRKAFPQGPRQSRTHELDATLSQSGGPWVLIFVLGALYFDLLYSMLSILLPGASSNQPVLSDDKEQSTKYKDQSPKPTTLYLSTSVAPRFFLALP